LTHAKEVLLKAAASTLPSYSVLLKITLLKYLIRASKICMLSSLFRFQNKNGEF